MTWARGGHRLEHERPDARGPVQFVAAPGSAASKTLCSGHARRTRTGCRARDPGAGQHASPALVSLATRYQARARTGTTNDKPSSNHEHPDLRLEYKTVCCNGHGASAGGGETELLTGREVSTLLRALRLSATCGNGRPHSGSLEFADTEEVTGSNPVAPTNKALTSGNAGQ